MSHPTINTMMVSAHTSDLLHEAFERRQAGACARNTLRSRLCAVLRSSAAPADPADITALARDLAWRRWTTQG